MVAIKITIVDSIQFEDDIATTAISASIIKDVIIGDQVINTSRNCVFVTINDIIIHIADVNHSIITKIVVIAYNVEIEEINTAI
jgi:hypothetical protein